MSSFKKFILGEKMPDKDDPKYKDRYEKEVNAGMKFAKAAKIDKIAISVQSFANALWIGLKGEVESELSSMSIQVM